MKDIVSFGLDPDRGYDTPDSLKKVLLECAEENLGLSLPDVEKDSAGEKYLMAIDKLHTSQRDLQDAYTYLVDAMEINGDTVEFERLSEIIKEALNHLPIS